MTHPTGDAIKADEQAEERIKSPLTSANVTALDERCRFMPDDAEDDLLEVGGIVHKFQYSKKRIAEATDEITKMLAELDDKFQLPIGGGWSFLNACEDRHYRQWTGLHSQVEILFCLGIAAGKAGYLLPREVWEALPGGMPYVVVQL